MIAFLDFETYSEGGFTWDPAANKWQKIPETTKGAKPGLPTIGAPAYAEHASTEALCLAWRLGDNWGFWEPALAPPVALFDHAARGGLFAAVNSFFEYVIWNGPCVRRHGWPPLPLDQLRDTAALARAHGVPGGLKLMGEALRLAIAKDPVGDRLIKKFSIPHNPTKKDPRRRILPQQEALDGALFYGYCVQDVAAEIAAHDKLPDLSPVELEIWKTDQKINARGVQIDTAALADCLEIVRQAELKYTAELVTITQGDVTTHAQLAKMGNWLSKHGVVMPNMQKGTIEEITPTLPPGPTRRVLEIRLDLNSASVKKLNAIKRQLSADGRLRGLYTYCGASRTRRWSGAGPQPQNMRRDGSASVDDWGREAQEAALKAVSTRSLEYLECVYGDPLATVGGCVRGLFTAAPGHELMCSDYSAIEAVVLAALAGEKWRLDVFNTHGMIYEMSASKISGVPFEEIDAKLRKSLGKVAELASGFSGWIDAWKRFGADKHFDDDSQIKNAILAWRDASPSIVEFWGGQYRRIGSGWNFRHEFHGVEGAAIKAILTPGKDYFYRSVKFCALDDVLYCYLPSGRPIVYHEPRLFPTVDRKSKQPAYKITYMGHNTDSTKGPVGWMRMSTYGGKLTENIVQSIARDIFAAALVRLERAGYRPVLHSHDEPVGEVPKGERALGDFETIMCQNPNWCADWPIKASGGWTGQRYFKG